jgi:5-methylcytosine-specific restriction endonuclease McrA
VSPKTRARAKTWAAVKREVFRDCGGRCQVGAPGCFGDAQHGHHKLPKAQGGDDVRANCLPVCFLCHRWRHDHPAESYARGFLLKREEARPC